MTDQGKTRRGSTVAKEKPKAVGAERKRSIGIETKGPKTMNMVIKNTMSKPLITIPPSMEVWQAVELIGEKNPRRTSGIGRRQTLGKGR